MSACNIVDGNMSVMYDCITQATFYNDPVLLGVFVIIGFVVLLLIGRHNMALGAMVLFAVSSVFQIISPAPLWGTISAVVLIGAVGLFIVGLVNRGQ